MSRVTLPFAVGDISSLAKSLRSQLAARTGTPGHVEMLNMLARAQGYRNFQQFRAGTSPADATETGVASTPRRSAEREAPDMRRVEQASRHFDDCGILLRWPGRASHQQLCLWVLWAAFPSGRALDEIAVNAFLSTRHAFGDAALLRRALYEARLVRRTPDGREYRRIEQKPSPDAHALIARLGVHSRVGAAQ